MKGFFYIFLLWAISFTIATNNSSRKLICNLYCSDIVWSSCLEYVFSKNSSIGIYNMWQTLTFYSRIMYLPPYIWNICLRLPPIWHCSWDIFKICVWLTKVQKFYKTTAWLQIAWQYKSITHSKVQTPHSLQTHATCDQIKIKRYFTLWKKIITYREEPHFAFCI